MEMSHSISKQCILLVHHARARCSLKPASSLLSLPLYRKRILDEAVCLEIQVNEINIYAWLLIIRAFHVSCEHPTVRLQTQLLFHVILRYIIWKQQFVFNILDSNA